MPKKLAGRYRKYAEGCFDPLGNPIDSDLELDSLVGGLQNLKGDQVSDEGRSIIVDIDVNPSNLANSKVYIGLPGGNKQKTVYVWGGENHG